MLDQPLLRHVNVEKSERALSTGVVLAKGTLILKSEKYYRERI